MCHKGWSGQEPTIQDVIDLSGRGLQEKLGGGFNALGGVHADNF